MGAIEDIYGDLDADVSEEEFRAAVEDKVEQMGGLADEEAAAMLVAHEFDEAGGVVEGIADVEAGMEAVEFVGKVVGVGELRTFERDDEEEEGMVINVEVADESGAIRAAFWDGRAKAIDDGEVEVGDVLRIEGRPKEGLGGVEVSVNRAELDEETEIDVEPLETYRVEDLSLGLSDVDLVGRLLDTDAVRTFERDDGSEGRVANLVVGDETGRVRVTLWDERADLAEELEPGIAVEVSDGYVRERDGDLELHVGSRGAVEEVDADVEYVPDTTDVADLELGDTADIAGVVRSADPVRTFDRDDGTEGQVRNIRVQDATGDIRVALWGEKADVELGPGDEVHLADVRVEDGWQDDIEAAANWRSSVSVLESTPGGGTTPADGPEGRGLAAFAGESAGAAGDGGDAAVGGDAADAGGDATDAGGATGGAEDSAGQQGAAGDGAVDGGAGAEAEAAEGDVEAEAKATGPVREEGAAVEFTGTVVQSGDPVVLDDGRETVGVDTDADVTLGEQVTVRGTYRDGRVDADELL